MNKSNPLQSYKDALEYFTKHNSFFDSNRLIEAAMNYRYCAKTEVNPPNITERLDALITQGTFILVDGPSCSGKSTLAQKLAKRYNAQVLDIDMLCLEYAEKLIEDGNPELMVLMNFSLITDDFLKNNLERLVNEAAIKGPVVLVGMYTQLVMRSIIAITLGRKFQNSLSIFCFEDDASKFQKAITQRKIAFNNPASNFENQEVAQYQVANAILQFDSNIMGIGFNESIRCNYSTISKITI